MSVIMVSKVAKESIKETPLKREFSIELDGVAYRAFEAVEINGEFAGVNAKSDDGQRWFIDSFMIPDCPLGLAGIEGGSQDV